MPLRVFLLCLMILSSAGWSLCAQEKTPWNTLAKIEIETRFDENLQFDIEYPIFSDEVKALDNKEITIEGFMIPLDELRGKNYFVLSSLPFATCFFCGGAGPETVMEVFTKEGVPFTERKIKVKGVLSINADDPTRLLYVLKDAVQIK